MSSAVFGMHNFRIPGQAPKDVADLLPDEARAKLIALRDERDDLLATTRSATDSYIEATKVKQDCEQRVRELTDHNVAARYGTEIQSEDSNPVKVARAELALALDELKRITEKRDVRNHRWNHVANIVQSAERYLDSVSEPLAPFTGTVKKASSLDAARKTIDSLRADRQQVQAAPFPSSKVKQAIRSQVDALAAQGRPDLFGAVEYGAPVGWPKTLLTIPSSGLMLNDDKRTSMIGSARTETVDTMALFAWVHRDALLAALDKELAEVADDDAALDDATRAKKLQQIAEALLDAERADCALVAAGNDTMAYRIDTDPRALLGIVGPAGKDD
ncbi:hypothetical protein [Mesorhizobium sp.]|uniref:hypothetical protein n=1 Tax=Mesorhizobium sp. TaxID=1871066 RepID=UPI000FE74604|nr:hypothetical protein [Mesorhizobium sp.]RWI92863.1 MAG: hypothetical protein EOR21_17200 [Mesorhizobium sp.]